MAEHDEIKIYKQPCPNGKCKMKLNQIYVGTYTEEESVLIERQIYGAYMNNTPIQSIQQFLRDANINTIKGDAISQGMNGNKTKYYNKKLPISTINRIKQMAREYGLTENEVIIKLVNEYPFQY